MGFVETRRPQKTASAYFGEPRKRGGTKVSARLPMGVGRWTAGRGLVDGGTWKPIVLFLRSFHLWP